MRPGGRGRSATGLVTLAFAVTALAGCAGSGTRAASVGQRTETVRTGSVLGDRASLEVTTEPSVVDERLSHAPDEVWSALPTVFQLLRVETPVLEPAAFTIGNPRFTGSRIGGSRLSNYLDCGNGIGGPNADRYQVELYLMVEVRGATGGGSLVRTTIDAFASPRDVTGNSLHCTSKSTLERRILDMVGELAGV